MSDFHAEYQEGYSEFNDAGVVFYKFFRLFSVRISGDEALIRFGRNIHDEDVSKDVAQKFKDYIKEQCEWVREQGPHVNSVESRRRMWWLVEKIIEHGIFTSAEQKSVMIWLDVCLQRTTTP